MLSLMLPALVLMEELFTHVTSAILPHSQMLQQPLEIRM